MIKTLGAAVFACMIAMLSLACMAQDGDGVLFLGDEPEGEYELTRYLRVIEDVEGSWEPQQAIDEFDSRPLSGQISGVDNFGLSDSVYWARVDVLPDAEYRGEWLLEMTYPALDRIDLFYRDATGAMVRKTSGDMLPFATRDLEYPSVIFSLQLARGSVTPLYFRVESQGSVQFPMRLWQAEAFHNNEAGRLLGRGLYYGIMLAMVFYNLFIFLSVRDISYLYYICYVLGIMSYQFSNDGFALQYLWPANPELGTYSVTFSACMALMFGLLFCRSFLQVREYSPRIDRGLRNMVVLTALAGIAPFLLWYKVAAVITPVLSIVVAIAIMLVGTWIMLKGYRPARFFMLAWIVFLSATIEVSMQRYGLLGSNFFTENGLFIGTAMEVILLSLALADRINTLTRDREQAVDRLLENNALTIQALERADAMKNEFIANVSHELRTPLTGMVGLLDIVLPRMKGKVESADMHNLAMVRSSGWRLTALVNDIVDISAINRDYIRLNRKAVDIHSVVDMVLAMCGPLVGNKPLELVSKVPDDLPLVFVDEDRIQQIIFNLVSNAVKFTYEGEIVVAAESAGKTVRISVRDTGVGIEKADQEKIFDAFQQADSSMQRQFGGTGLGLSITRKLLQLHGSDIDVESVPGEGACFRFELPVAETAAGRTDERELASSGLLPSTPKPFAPAPGIPPSPASTATDSTRTILIVDDEAINLHVLREYLKDRYRLLLAQDGFEALDVLESETPDLVMLDLMMPRMSGYELCEKIRERFSPADLPILILTAKNQVEDMVTGLRTGANDYLSKPFFREELLARIDKQLQLRELIATRDENIRLQEQIRRYREAEHRLHASRQRLASMLDVSGDALLAVDEGGDIVYINRQGEAMLGLESAYLVGRPIEILGGDQERHSFAFPFRQELVSENPEAPLYFDCSLPGFRPDGSVDEQSVIALRACILPLDLEQEFYVIVLGRNDVEERLAGAPTPARPAPEMPRLIEEVNRNTRRVQLIGELLLRISAEKLQRETHLLDKLAALDELIEGIAASVDVDRRELDFRQALVELMQHCVDVWQRTTRRSVLDLAEESRIWRVSIDNGRLRARSMERYLSLDKLPRNPRWREVSRTAYYLLANPHLADADKALLESSLQTMQELLRGQR